jgi:putative methyltransferase (TIGR04325 family)
MPAFPPAGPGGALAPAFARQGRAGGGVRGLLRRAARRGGAAAGLAACSVIAKNRLAQARVLAASLRRHHPRLPFFVLLVDEPEGFFAPADEPFAIVRPADLAIPDLPALCFRYSLAELVDAVTPYLLEHLLVDRGASRLLYLDADLLVKAPLDPLFERLAACSILLSPHVTQPIEHGGLPDERELLLAGVYNSGLIGLADTAAARRMLGWWQRRLRHHAAIRPAEGLCGNQRWLDLVPALFAGKVGLITDPGYNVAYWNLHERPITLRPEPRAAGAPLRCFHFSGYDPEAPERISRHQDQYSLESLGEARALFDEYRELLLAAGWQASSRWPYSYDRFANGVRVTAVLRDLYARGAGDRPWPDPFAAGEGSLLAWLSGPAAGEEAAVPQLSRALLHLWSTRLDLQRAFPQVQGAQRAAFISWARGFAAHEDQLDPFFFAPLGPTEWELAAGGWQAAAVALRGWDVEELARTQAAGWCEFSRLTQGTGPLGLVYESPAPAADDGIHHNTIMSYGYVLARASRRRSRISLLDWGGGLGHYYLISRALLPEVEIDYHCQEVPALARTARRLNPQLHFCAPEDGCLERSYDLVLVSGSLQYSEDWRAALARLAVAAGRYLYLTRLPIVQRAASFAVVQRPYASGYQTEYVGWFLNRGELLAAVAKLGLVLVREFLVQERPHVHAAPEQCEYRGFLFQPPGTEEMS